MHFRQDWLSDILLKHNPQILKISFIHQSLHIQKLLGSSVNSRRLEPVDFELAMRYSLIHR